MLVMFTKMLKRSGELDLDAAGDVLVDLGFDGGDLTVRDGGYVDPGEVESELPEAVDLLESKGLAVPMITTGITAADERAETIFRTAADCGVDHLKLGYWQYDGFGRFREQLNELRVTLDRIYALSAEYPVTPSLHVHSGDFMTANATAIWELLRGYDPDRIGAYVDPGHMALEGGRSGWKIGLDVLQEFVSLVAVKNFRWERTDAGDEVSWTKAKAPLDRGVVPYPEVVECLETMEFDGPMSVHSEYYDLPFDDLLDQTRADVTYLRELLADSASEP